MKIDFLAFRRSRCLCRVRAGADDGSTGRPGPAAITGRSSASPASGTRGSTSRTACPATFPGPVVFASFDAMNVYRGGRDLPGHEYREPGDAIRALRLLAAHPRQQVRVRAAVLPVRRRRRRDGVPDRPPPGACWTWTASELHLRRLCGDVQRGRCVAGDGLLDVVGCALSTSVTCSGSGRPPLPGMNALCRRVNRRKLVGQPAASARSANYAYDAAPDVARSGAAHDFRKNHAAALRPRSTADPADRAAAQSAPADRLGERAARRRQDCARQQLSRSEGLAAPVVSPGRGRSRPAHILSLPRPRDGSRDRTQGARSAAPDRGIPREARHSLVATSRN